MSAKLADIGLDIVAMLTMGATQAPAAGHGAIKGSAGIRLQEKKSTTPWKLRALFLISATIVAAILVSAPPADAGQRTVRAYTTDNDQGGYLHAIITWERIGNTNTYKGSVQGRYEDVEADGYCVVAFRTGSGGKNWYRLGPTACPKGKSQSFDYQYGKAKKAGVQVCRWNNKLQKEANCSGFK